MKKKFGEIPKGRKLRPAYSCRSEIQAEEAFIISRVKTLNRDIETSATRLPKSQKHPPENYQSDTWRNFPFSEKYAELNRIKDDNNKTERAKAFAAAYTAKLAAAKSSP